MTEVAGREVENEDLVNVPNWLPLRFRIAGGEWFDAQRADVERAPPGARHAHGNAHPASWPGRTPDGRRTRWSQRRFVS